MERRCNGVYFRNNSLLSLKGTKRKAGCLSYPEYIWRWWKEEQWKKLAKARDQDGTQQKARKVAA